MKIEKVICDKCHRQDTGDFAKYYSTIRVPTPQSWFGLPEIHLCELCTKEFTNWLKGEPIPKQTTFPKFNVSTSKRKTKP